jgi:putative FmdB family regulatory protein
MPTYHYSCENCGYEFEIEQKITDPPRKRCPNCRRSVYRVIHPVGHILKGSGFYRTDYRNEDFKKKESAEKDSTSEDKPIKHKDKKHSKND